MGGFRSSSARGWLSSRGVIWSSDGEHLDDRFDVIDELVIDQARIDYLADRGRSGRRAEPFSKADAPPLYSPSDPYGAAVRSLTKAGTRGLPSPVVRSYPAVVCMP